MRVSRGEARPRWPSLASVLCCILAVSAHTVSATPPPQRQDSLHFVVVAPRSVRVGKPVPVTLRLTNAGKRKVDLYLLGRSITFDIIVAGPDGSCGAGWKGHRASRSFRSRPSRRARPWS